MLEAPNQETSIGFERGRDEERANVIGNLFVNDESEVGNAEFWDAESVGQRAARFGDVHHRESR